MSLMVSQNKCKNVTYFVASFAMYLDFQDDLW